MDWFRLLFAAALALVGIAALAQLVWAYLNIPSLVDVPPMPLDGKLPRVSIVVAARDEERHIESAVRALARQSYTNLEIIVVDDRSADATPDVLARLGGSDSRPQVVRGGALPEGWLGKNHALHVGAPRARGDFLLFADGDVILGRDALSRAVRLMKVAHADHLAVSPDIVMPSTRLALVVNYFMMWFLLYLRPWRARNPK